MLDELVKWLESERMELEDNAHSAKPDLFEAGYYGAIMNTLDFLMGSRVYTAWKEGE